MKVGRSWSGGWGELGARVGVWQSGGREGELRASGGGSERASELERERPSELERESDQESQREKVTSFFESFHQSVFSVCFLVFFFFVLVFCPPPWMRVQSGIYMCGARRKNGKDFNGGHEISISIKMIFECNSRSKII